MEGADGSGRNDVVVRLGGSAGDGVQSAGEIIARMLSRSGLYISTYNGNQSLVRGGLVWFHVHAAPWRVRSLGFGIDCLVSLSQSFHEEHIESVSQGGIDLHDSAAVKVCAATKGVAELSLPLSEIALRHDRTSIMRNIAAVASLAAALGLDRKVLDESIAQQYGESTRTVENMKVAAESYSLFAERFGVVKKLDLDYEAERPFMNGNEALALGAAAAGCRFYAAYPMSPASSIVHWMASHARALGITVYLGEDEISVINSTIGASFAGARAMCGTSGGGFALMQEAIGMAAMTETPVVVVDVMRAGPSTGLPTKTSQGDLNMVLGISQDDFPRVVLAPRNPEECFYAAGRAFNLADEFQVPVIVLSDFAISDGGYSTVNDLDFDMPISRGKIAREFDASSTNGTWFKRFQLTPDDVSPRSFPGTEGMMFVAKTDEHDEYGHDLSDVLSGLKESVRLRERMQEKRMGKLEAIRKRMSPPELVGHDKADLTIVCWGSSSNAVREAVGELQDRRLRVNSLEFAEIYPLDGKRVASFLRGCNRLLNVEANYSGQFAHLLRAETGIAVTEQFLKYNGEPIYPMEVVRAAEKALGRRGSPLV